MANNKKRNRAQAVSAKEPLPSEQKPKKKAKFAFSKTVTTNVSKAAVANSSKPTDKKERLSLKESADAVASLGDKKKKKKKNKRSGAAAPVNDAAVAGKQAAKPKTKGKEIDDLFASLKTDKQMKSIAEEQQKLAAEEEERREKKEKERLQQQIKKLEAQNTNSTAGGLNPDPRPVRYDEDGLPIYTESSLQIGKGGNTKDCPFDCWCCF